MFRVLVQRQKARLINPRSMAWIALAHGVVALVTWVAYRRATAQDPPGSPPEYVVEFPIFDDPTVVATADPQPALSPAGTRELLAPDSTPTRITPPDPRERPVDPRDYSGMGPIARVEVSLPRHTPDRPETRRVYPNFNDGVLPAEFAEVQPVMADPAEAGRLLQRNYPVELAQHQVSGRTLVEIVVEPNGRVRRGSAHIVETSHQPFAEATLRIIERLRFTPARVGEQPVAVAVKVPIVWRAPEP